MAWKSLSRSARMSSEAPVTFPEPLANPETLKGFLSSAAAPGSMEEPVTLVVWMPEERRGHLWQSEERLPHPQTGLCVGSGLSELGFA